jgi:hypothetical protein
VLCRCGNAEPGDFVLPLPFTLADLTAGAANVRLNLEVEARNRLDLLTLNYSHFDPKPWAAQRQHAAKNRRLLPAASYDTI